MDSLDGHVNTAKLDALIQNEFKKYFNNHQTFEKTQNAIHNHPLNGIEGTKPFPTTKVLAGASALLIITAAGILGEIQRNRRQAKIDADAKWASSRKPKTNS